MKKLLVVCLALVMVLGSMSMAFAADVNTPGNGETQVQINAEAATFSVTVPTTLVINVAADGTVTPASAAKIVNNSHGAVKVTNMTVEGVGEWEIVDFDSANMVAEKVGAKKIALSINTDTTTADDTISFTASNFPKLDGANAEDTDELPIVYEAKVAPQATELDAEGAVTVTFVLAWDN